MLFTYEAVSIVVRMVTGNPKTWLLRFFALLNSHVFSNNDSDTSTAEAVASSNNEYCKPDKVEPDDNKQHKALGVPEPTDDASPYYVSPEKKTINVNLLEVPGFV